MICVVSTEQLLQIAQKSEKAGLARLPNEAFWDQIDQHGKHVLNPFPLPGEYRFVRTFAMCKLKKGNDPAEVWIDVTAEDWRQLLKESHE